MRHMIRPLRARCDEVPVTSAARLARGGGRVLMLNGPAGPVGPIGTTDKPYVGMDPSDPKTYTRPYNPVPGMIAWLNYDGAMPNTTQTGPNRQRVPR